MQLNFMSKSVSLALRRRRRRQSARAILMGKTGGALALWGVGFSMLVAKTWVSSHMQGWVTLAMALCG